MTNPGSCEFLRQHADYWRVKGYRSIADQLESAAAEIADLLDISLPRQRLEEENRDLKEEIGRLWGQLLVASRFVKVRKCRSCTGYYPVGYVCECGCDNSAESEVSE